MNPLVYAAKVIACSAILLGYYHLFLRNQKFHRYNRFYLLASAAFSVLLPLYRIPVFYDSSAAATTWMKPLYIFSAISWEDAFVVTVRTGTLSFFNFRNVAWIVYTTGFATGAVSMLRSLLYIKKLSRIYQRERLDDITFYNTCEPGTPFSFFHTLFWNSRIPIDNEKGRYILQHELFHIREKHSYDVFFLHILTNLFWFNPFFYFLLKELKTIHEFLADEWAGSTISKYDYAELLLMQTIQGKNRPVSHSFFHHQIKRRIAMIIKQQPSNTSYLSRVVTLPLFFALFSAFTFQVGCRDKTLTPGSTGANTGLMPAAEFMKIMENREQNKGITLKEDPSTNLLTAKFKDGTSISTHLDEFRKLNPSDADDLASNSNPIFTKVETDASFPGGPKAYMRFLNRTYKYPEEALAEEIQGTVILQFIVQKNGDVEDIQVISGPEGGGLRDEAVRIIKVSGKWTPAMQNGHAVASYKKQPVIFRLDSE